MENENGSGVSEQDENDGIIIELPDAFEGEALSTASELGTMGLPADDGYEDGSDDQAYAHVRDGDRPTPSIGELSIPISGPLCGTTSSDPPPSPTTSRGADMVSPYSSPGKVDRSGVGDAPLPRFGLYGRIDD